MTALVIDGKLIHLAVVYVARVEICRKWSCWPIRRSFECCPTVDKDIMALYTGVAGAKGDIGSLRSHGVSWSTHSIQVRHWRLYMPVMLFKAEFPSQQC